MTRRAPRRAQPKKNPESRIGKTILDSSARTVYVLGYADRVEDLGLEGASGGQDWFDVAPAGWSLAAQEWAEELWTEIVAKNPLAMPSGSTLTESIEECFREACAKDKHLSDWNFEDPDSGDMRDCYEFGHYIAMQALGTGVQWKDDHADHGLKIPRRESDPWGIVPDADLAPLVSVFMLRGEIEANTEAQIANEDYEEDRAVTLLQEVEGALEDYDNNTGGYLWESSALAAYISALSRLHDHLNYASAYENEGLHRAAIIADILLAGASRVLYLMQHPDEKDLPRKNPRRQNPVIEWTDKTPRVVQDFTEPSTVALAYDLVLGSMRHANRNRSPCFIVANASSAGRAPATRGVPEHDVMAVDLTIYVPAVNDNGPGEATVEELAEYAREHANLIFRDQLTIHMDSEPSRGAHVATSGTTPEAAIRRALFSFQQTLDVRWPVEVDGQLMELRALYGGRKITITFEIITPESAEAGDFAETGWENEDGVSMEPDEHDIEDEKTAVDLAVKFLRDEGAYSDGSSDNERYIGDPIQNRDYFEQGIEEIHNYFLENFDDSELEEIHKRMTTRSNPAPADPESCKRCGVDFVRVAPNGLRVHGATRDAKDMALCEPCGKKADIEFERERIRERIREEREDARMLLADRQREQLNPIPKYEEGAYGGGFPRWRGRSDGRGVQKGIDWDTQPLGKVSDRELSRRLGVSKSVVTEARRARQIPPAPRSQ